MKNEYIDISQATINHYMARAHVERAQEFQRLYRDIVKSIKKGWNELTTRGDERPCQTC